MKELSIEQKGQNRIFPELKESKESEDERIRKALIRFHKSTIDVDGIKGKDIVAWLEKQGEHANFRNKIQIGDKVTRNEDGVLINLSQLNRVAKKDEKQGKNDMGISEATKQELEDNLNKALEKETSESWNKFLDEQSEPKFKVEKDKWYVCISQYCNCIEGRNYRASLDGRIIDDYGTEYDMHDDAYRWFRPWTIKDAKDGDVLMSRAPFIYGRPIPYGGLDWYNGKFIKASNYVFKDSPVHPATKDQRDLLFQKMKEARFEWDTEKKELKKIEQKLVDKARPKFHEGDWLVNIEYGNIVRVLEVLENNYRLDYGVDTIGTLCTELVDNDYRLWDISKDAKDGDVLINKSNNIEGQGPFIFKETKPSDIKTDCLNPLTVLGYCGIGGAGFTKGSGWGDTANCMYYPATKEQCNQLGKAMTDARYTFDFEKKKLKKIVDEEQIKKNLQDNSFRRMFEQKPTEWSEEDERMYRGLHNLIYSTPYCDSRKEFSEWFKSLKDRVLPQPKQEWSKKDERMYRGIHYLIYATQYCNSRKEFSDWLKFLKERVQVQPKQEWSEEDEDILNTIINHFKVDIECTDEDDVVRWLKSLKERFGCEANCTTTKDWGEDDEIMLGKCIDAASGYYSPEDKQNMKDWLRAIKDRVLPQQKQEWSEKDEYHKRQILRILKDNGCSQTLQEKTEKWIEERLKSNTWKPSDEQITWLYRAADEASKDSRMKQILNELLSDLKKLRKDNGI